MILKTTQAHKRPAQVVLETSLAFLVVVVLLIASVKTMVYFLNILVGQQKAWSSTRTVGSNMNAADVKDFSYTRQKTWIIE